MRKFISILLIVVCICCLAACKSQKNLPDETVTTTPPASQQGGEVTDGTTDGDNIGTENNQGTVENNFPVDPDNSGDPGIDLEEDILTSDDDPTPTAGIVTPTAAPNQTNTPETTNSGTQNTATPTATATNATATATPTATAAPAKATPSSITLPMDFF